ncbi:hypothetical protein F5884DRAFT_765006 [Xylogone sp. PMI_703]|nr:hypothetical protein F5884DRAFT_765006 [Xylogone sp. PMI_703]
MADKIALAESSEDEDYEDDNPAIVQESAQDELRAGFEEIRDKVRKGQLKLRESKNRTEFYNQYVHLLSKRTRADQQNLFHLFAGELDHKSSTRCLMRKAPQLLQDTDDSGRTPLHIAIVKKNSGFIQTVLEVVKKKEMLDGLLSMQCDHSRNCIHLAVFHKLDPTSVISLVEQASEKTLSAQDQDGLTPVHLAVEYDRSSEAQLKVVETMIRFGDAALDKNTKTTGLSVYRYHEWTRDKAKKRLELAITLNSEKLEKTTAVVNQGQRSNQAKARGNPDVLNEHRADRTSGHHDPSKPERDDGRAPVAAPNVKALRRRDSAFEPPRTSGNSSPYTTTAPPFPPADEVSLLFKSFAVNPDPAFFKSPGLQRQATNLADDRRKDEEKEKKIQEQRTKETWADKIRRELKLHYLRTTFRTDSKYGKRTELMASRFLHGPNLENHSLSFDYSKGPTRVWKDSFDESYRHMKFDEVLRYVRFGKVELQKPKPSLDSRLAKRSARMAATGHSGRGRNDLSFFFDWLYNKGVRYILKVVVDDLHDPSHSDRAIEDCLRRFVEIETLEWRKVDLCPETIFNACRNVQELSLWWSGNRIALRAWGEPEGLVRLKKLERVHLIWNTEQVLEDDDYIKAFIEDFKARLTSQLQNGSEDAEEVKQENGTKNTEATTEENDKPKKRTIEVFQRKADVLNSEQLVLQGEQSNMMVSINERNLQSNKWLDCMDKFADWIQNVKFPETKTLTLKEGVKIGLIDDGVDPYVESLRGKICGGQSYDQEYPDENGPLPYYTSSDGHGTVMAEMICRVFPMAQIYVYKLEVHSTRNPATQTRGRAQISAYSAAEAVNDAVSQGVDIISMSWTIVETEDNRDGIQKLRDAIKFALDRGVLLFCAAGDSGAIQATEHPWSSDKERIFRIGAATADGRIWESTGTPSNLSFIVPGYKVVARNRHREGTLPQEFKERTGSSIATALAAGLAALIMNCVRLGAIQSELEKENRNASSIAVKEADYKFIKSYKCMKDVLISIGLDQTQQKFIEVWKQFDIPSPILNLASDDDASKMAFIAELARNLVSGIHGRGNE